MITRLKQKGQKDLKSQSEREGDYQVMSSEYQRQWKHPLVIQVCVRVCVRGGISFKVIKHLFFNNRFNREWGHKEEGAKKGDDFGEGGQRRGDFDKGAGGGSTGRDDFDKGVGGCQREGTTLARGGLEKRWDDFSESRGRKRDRTTSTRELREARKKESFDKKKGRTLTERGAKKGSDSTDSERAKKG